MIKIFKNYNATFTVDLNEIPSSLEFVVPVTGSFSITGSFTSVANGVQVDLTSAQTATFPTGSAQMYAIVSGIPTAVGEATISQLTTVTESHAEKVLSAIEATLESRATKEQSELTIAGRQVKYISLTELLKIRQEYKQIVAQEKIANGLYQKTGTKIITRWGRS